MRKNAKVLFKCFVPNIYFATNGVCQGEKFSCITKLHLQEDHDDPLSLTWANRFIYLIKFHTNRLLEDFCINSVLKSDMMVLYKWPLGWVLIWPQGYNSNNHVGQQDEATHQISKAWAF